MTAVISRVFKTSMKAKHKLDVTLHKQSKGFEAQTAIKPLTGETCSLRGRYGFVSLIS